jgi:L-alanine-DL-glutamate epimerase-like enolase superfamily enzyme
VKEPFDWENGYLKPPDRPGIGIELNEESLDAHRGTLEEGEWL